MGNLRKDIGTRAVAVLTLALGIAAATTVFSLVDTVLLRPLPVAGQERLAVVWENAKKRQSGLVEASYPNYRDWRDQNRVFTSLAALMASNSALNLTGAGEPLQVEGSPVSGNFFDTLGVEPRLGRALAPEDDRAGTPPVVVLSDRLWREQFKGDPGIVGRQVRLDGRNYTVVGVMPPAFEIPHGARLWVPLLPYLGPDVSEQRNNLVLKAIGRMKPGVTLAQANSEMETLAARLEKQHMQFNEGFSANALSFVGEIVGGSRPVLMVALAGSLLLLLIAVADAAGLTAVRAPEQRRATLLPVLGASAGGLLLALLGMRLLRALAPRNIPRIDEIGLDGRILLFHLAATLLAMAALAAMTAVGRAPRLATGRLGGRLRLLARFELAFALLALIAAGILAYGMFQLARVHPGFDRRNVLTVRVQLPETTYPDGRQRQVFFDRLRDRAAGLPGVASAAIALARPLDDSSIWEIPISMEGQTHDELEHNPLVNFQAVSPGYFDTLGVRRLAGRDFNAGDTESSTLVAVVGKSLAERFWPGASPVGKRVRRTLSNQILPQITIVGMVDDVHYHGWDQASLDFYIPSSQNPLTDYITSQDLILQAEGDPAALSRPVHEAVYGLDPDQAVASALTIGDLVDRALAGPRFFLAVTLGLGALALYLAMVGLYVYFSATAVPGASGKVISQGLKLIALGMPIGIAAGCALSRFVGNPLASENSLDLSTCVAAGAALFVLLFLSTSFLVKTVAVPSEGGTEATPQGAANA
jgi:putative ABC transport system permease protein